MEKVFLLSSDKYVNVLDGNEELLYYLCKRYSNL